MKNIIVLLLIIVNILGCDKYNKPVKCDPRFPDPWMINGIEHFTGKNIINVKNEDLLQFKELLLGEDIKNIKGIELFSNLENLELQRTQINNLNDIKNLNNLKYLNIWGTNITDISPIHNLNNLERLVLDTTKITSLEPIRNLKKIRVVYISNFLKYSKIDDFSSLSGLENIEKIDIKVKKISVMPDFSNLNKLKYLHISCKNKLDSSPISKAKNIETLMIGINLYNFPEKFTGEPCVK